MTLRLLPEILTLEFHECRSAGADFCTFRPNSNPTQGNIYRGAFAASVNTSKYLHCKDKVQLKIPEI